MTSMLEAEKGIDSLQLSISLGKNHHLIFWWILLKLCKSSFSLLLKKNYLFSFKKFGCDMQNLSFSNQGPHPVE